jgi:hypothetical protein
VHVLTLISFVKLSFCKIFCKSEKNVLENFRKNTSFCETKFCGRYADFRFSWKWKNAFSVQPYMMEHRLINWENNKEWIRVLDPIFAFSVDRPSRDTISLNRKKLAHFSSKLLLLMFRFKKSFVLNILLRKVPGPKYFAYSMACLCYPLQGRLNRFILLASLLITPSPFAQFEFWFFFSEWQYPRLSSMKIFIVLTASAAV